MLQILFFQDKMFPVPLLNVSSKVLIQDWQGQTRIPVIFDKVVLFLMSYPSRLEPKRSHVRIAYSGGEKFD